MAQQIYASVLVSLQAVDSCHLRNIPPGLELDEGILELLLINRQTGQCVIARNGDTSNDQPGKRQLNNGHRLDILKTFHNQAVDVMDDLLKRNTKVGDFKALESYWTSDYYKLHALVQGEYLICAMYSAALPVHTMRLISKETLKMVLMEKDLCF